MGPDPEPNKAVYSVIVHFSRSIVLLSFHLYFSLPKGLFDIFLYAFIIFPVELHLCNTLSFLGITIEQQEAWSL